MYSMSFPWRPSSELGRLTADTTPGEQTEQRHTLYRAQSHSGDDTVRSGGPLALDLTGSNTTQRSDLTELSDKLTVY